LFRRIVDLHLGAIGIDVPTLHADVEVTDLAPDARGLLPRVSSGRILRAIQPENKIRDKEQSQRVRVLGKKLGSMMLY
jgi:hypothetical protein